MKRRMLNFTYLAMAVIMLTGCSTQSQIDANTTSLEKDSAEDESSVVSENENEEYDCYYNINRIIDNHTVELSRYFSVFIPSGDYQIGDTVEANDGRTYNIVSFDDAIDNTCIFEDDEQRKDYFEMFDLNRISKRIAASIQELHVDYEYTGYYVLGDADTDEFGYYLYNVTTEGPESLYHMEFETEPEVFTVDDATKVTILNFVDDESLSNEEQFCYEISISDFMAGNFPDTAFYHQAEDHYYYKDIDGKDSYSYGICKIKGRVITEITEIYQP